MAIVTRVNRIYNPIAVEIRVNNSLTIPAIAKGSAVTFHSLAKTVFKNPNYIVDGIVLSLKDANDIVIVYRADMTLITASDFIYTHITSISDTSGAYKVSIELQSGLIVNALPYSIAFHLI